MPIYEFRCEECGEIQEVIWPPGSSPEEAPICPKCGSQRTSRILSPHSAIGAGSHTQKTCCGREERCKTPPCHEGGVCTR
jgi:putative FmdB family regulatory protein